LQNTDPFVFGGEFRYSWCLQPSRRSLRDLDMGSVILFGSRVNWKFVLDTVFVLILSPTVRGTVRNFFERSMKLTKQSQ